MNAEDKNEVLVRVENVSKKFCRSLRKSLWYGVCDMAEELVPRTSRRRESESGTLYAQVEDNRPLRDEEFWAVKDVSFELRRGECLGLIGHNGAGKTTLLKMLNGLIKPDSGRITMRGRVGALISLGAGFNPILSGRENIYVNAAVLGLKKCEIDEKVEAIIDFAEIGTFVDAPVQSYSSGMQVRLGFAVATTLNPDILILDEVLAVGDMSFHAKCFKKIGEITRNAAVIFVSHDISSVSRICSIALLLQNGSTTAHGECSNVVNHYNESARRRRLEQSTIEQAESINFFSICLKTENQYSLKPTDNLSFTVKLESRHRQKAGRFLISLYHNGSVQAGQIDLSNDVHVLQEGGNEFCIEAQSLNLASGHYTVNCAIFGQDNRLSLVHAINCADFSIDGLPYYGSAYKIPAKLIQRTYSSGLDT